MFRTLRSCTLSSSLLGENIKQGAWLAPPNTARYVSRVQRGILVTHAAAQMATKLAMSLGLGNDVVGQNSSERERTLLRSTWTSVVQLQQIAASRA
jgi:hypothetical protein